MSRIDRTGGISATGIETAPTNERRTQNGGVVSEAVSPDTPGKPANRYRAVYECALDVYLHRKIITEPQHLAGLRFRQAYRRAVLSASATRERLNRYPSTEGLTKSEKLIKDAYRTLEVSSVWLADVVTLLMLLEISAVPCAACCTFREISPVADTCS